MFSPTEAERLKTQSKALRGLGGEMRIRVAHVAMESVHQGCMRWVVAVSMGGLYTVSGLRTSTALCWLKFMLSIALQSCWHALAGMYPQALSRYLDPNSTTSCLSHNFNPVIPPPPIS